MQANEHSLHFIPYEMLFEVARPMLASHGYCNNRNHSLAIGELDISVWQHKSKTGNPCDRLIIFGMVT